MTPSHFSSRISPISFWQWYHGLIIIQNYNKLKLNVNATNLVTFIALYHFNIGSRNHADVR